MEWNEGTPGGGYRRESFEEKYPGFEQGRPEQGWNPQNYGWSSDHLVVSQGKRHEYEALGLQTYDMIVEGDNEVYYIMGAPEDTNVSEVPNPRNGSWYDPYLDTATSWAVDIASIDWGSYIPGLDIMSDTLNSIGSTVELETKGRLLRAKFDKGFTQREYFYEFPSENDLHAFLNKMGQDLGEDYYAQGGLSGSQY